MLAYDRFELSNGLRVLVHREPRNPIVSFNLLYDVGSRDEHPSRTGFAHLFEHLMFGGSVNVPNFDGPLEKVGGQNNAFTSNDITNYYITVPRGNIETAFWLESDRMLELDFSERSLEVQKNVVVEEFNQQYLNQPYGDVWLHLCPLAYKVHPYRWPTIGMSPQHILDATLSDVKGFFYNHYAPNNAILSVVGDISTAEVEGLANKWFGPIASRHVPPRNLPREPMQTEHRELTLKRDVPYHSIYMVYHMCSKTHADFRTTDLISDILSNGKSSRLYQRLVKELRQFSSVNAYITGDIDEGLLVITGRLIDGVSFDVARASIEGIIEDVASTLIEPKELDKVKNRFEANNTFDRSSPLDKAMKLGYYELLGNANLYNMVLPRYQAITPDDVRRVASDIFRQTNRSILYYEAKSAKT